MDMIFRHKMLFAGMGFIILIAVLIVVVREYKQKKEPIKVGLAITLTGRPSTFGVHTRNGFILALEQLNRTGGIGGRPIELIVKDDKANPEQALRVDQELLDAGVMAIIGHSLSTPTVASVPLMSEAPRPQGGASKRNFDLMWGNLSPTPLDNKPFIPVHSTGYSG